MQFFDHWQIVAARRNLSIPANRALGSFLVVVFAALLPIAFSSCSVPLAPGYKVLKESCDVRFVSGSAPELQIRAHYVLQNSGNSDLRFVDVVLPDAKLYGLKDLHAEVDGRESAFSDLPEEYQQETPGIRRILMDRPWMQKQTRELVISYSFSSPEDLGAQITLGAADFHLSSLGWSPALQPPKHVLSPFPRRPERTTYTVRVPVDFLILARGHQTGRKQEGGEVAYTFELRKDDLSPYMVAGRYTESQSSHRGSGAVLWTLQPLGEDAGRIEEHIARAWEVLQSNFGSFDQSIRAPHIVESAGLRAHLTGETGAAFGSFPGGVLVNHAALALGISSEAFLAKTIHALAHNWFGDEMYLERDAALGMGEGLPDYATIVIDEALGGEAARRRRIVKFLQEYDEARKAAVETPLGTTVLTDMAEKRRISLAKALLFYAALEDTCGEAQMRNSLAHMVVLMRGNEVGFEDLRAALEQSTGKDLAETFRVWLNEKGIPEKFRDRYSGEKD